MSGSASGEAGERCKFGVAGGNGCKVGTNVPVVDVCGENLDGGIVDPRTFGGSASECVDPSPVSRCLSLSHVRSC